jgi:hypothetical protein
MKLLETVQSAKGGIASAVKSVRETMLAQGEVLQSVVRKDERVARARERVLRAREEVNRIAAETAQEATRQAARLQERARAATEASKQYVREHGLVERGASAAGKVLPEATAKRVVEAMRRLTAPAEAAPVDEAASAGTPPAAARKNGK